MRAKLIYEKFEAESDPIQDMGIGGFMPLKHYEKCIKTIEKSRKEYRSYLNQFVGKTIEGNMHKYDSKSSTFKPFFGKVLIDSIGPGEGEGQLIKIVTKNPTEYYYLNVREKFKIK